MISTNCAHRVGQKYSSYTVKEEGRSNASGKQGWLKGSVKELTMVLQEGKERKNGGLQGCYGRKETRMVIKERWQEEKKKIRLYERMEER